MINCLHRDRDLSDGKMGESGGMGSGSGRPASCSAVLEGNIASR